METEPRVKEPCRSHMQTKQVVVVFDGKCDCINDIIETLLMPRKTGTGMSPGISVMGFADPAQVRKIVDIISERESLPQ